VPPPLEAPPLAAALLAAGPRGVPPPYILYPLLSNTTIQLYNNSFYSSDRNYINVEQHLWPHDEKVKDEENAEVIGPFSEEEVKRALFQMERNKAAGPDGLPVEFFQKN
jgi:hypothetical protein